MKSILSIKGLTGKIEVVDFVKMQSTTMVLIKDQTGCTYFIDANLLQIETYPDAEKSCADILTELNTLACELESHSARIVDLIDDQSSIAVSSKFRGKYDGLQYAAAKIRNLMKHYIFDKEGSDDI